MFSSESVDVRAVSERINADSGLFSAENQLLRDEKNQRRNY